MNGVGTPPGDFGATAGPCPVRVNELLALWESKSRCNPSLGGKVEALCAADSEFRNSSSVGSLNRFGPLYSLNHLD